MREPSSSLTGYHRRRAACRARRRRERKRRAIAVVCSTIAAAALIVTVAHPFGKLLRRETFSDNKALATSFDDKAWDEGSAQFPFIRYGRKGWALSDPMPFENITLCEINSRRFRCLLKEKEEHAAELMNIARELDFIPR